MILWWHYIVLSSVIPIVILIGILIGARIQRRAIVKDFDEILRRIQQLSLSRNYDGLDILLHDLLEDTPHVPRRLQSIMNRTHKVMRHE